MFALSFSNRFEVLLAQLIVRLEAESPGPFEVQQVIVPSAAVRRRIELELARRQGICANIAFPFLAQWLWERIGEVVEVPPESPFSPARLAWCLYALFGDARIVGAHPRLAGYLARGDARARFELAQRVARLFDHYVSYRPDWLEAWCAGRPAGLAGLDANQAADEAWQAALWRAALERLGLTRRHPFQTFLDALQSGHRGRPAPAHLFCLPGLPPQHLAMLRELGARTELQAYVLNPCQEYWTDIQDPRRLSWLKDGAEHVTVGHPLLAAWGKHTRAFVERLFDEGGEIVERNSLFVPADPGEAAPTLLARLQDAILDLTPFAPGGEELDGDDRSIEVHICHGLTRELEVLQDQLLALFAAPDAPRPEEVLVVLPDLVAAAPLIDGVFGTAPPPRRIPYVITGRPPAEANPVARAFTALLDLIGGRFPASAVFDLLQSPPVAARYDFDADTLDLIHAWFEQAGMRWGLDGAQKARLGLPDTPLFTLAEGLQRLMLAYALGDEGGSFRGRAAAGRVEAGEALVLARLWRLVENLRELDLAAAQPRPAAEWRTLLLAALDALVPESRDWVESLQAVRAAVVALVAHIETAAPAEPIPFAVLRAALQAQLEDAAKGGIPTGAVTFSAMTSLRHLPYAVICVLGLDRGAFPANPRPEEFDLLLAAPRKGDRQRREDDRNLFLDLLLAARRRFYLSYSGRSRRDASLQPPSVLVDELLDHLALALAEDPEDAKSLKGARARLCVEHPLQPFSAEAFDPATDPRRRSFDADTCAALTQTPAPQATEAPLAETEGEDENTAAEAIPPLFTTPLPPLPEDARSLSPAQLEQFFRNPCRALLRRLGLALPEEEAALTDDEPFQPEFGARASLAERLLPVLEAGVAEAEILPLARAGAEYPPGALGERALQDELALLRPYADGLHPALAEALLPPLPVDLHCELEGEDWALLGSLGELRATGLVRHRYDDLRAGDILAAWIQHLLLNALAPEGVAPTTRLFCRDGDYTLRPLDSADQARAHLGELLALVRSGLRAPLHFFPKSAWAYVQNDDSVSVARNKWQHPLHADWSESARPAYRIALRGLPDPIDEAFEFNARTVFGPLLAHLEGLE